MQGIDMDAIRPSATPPPAASSPPAASRRAKKSTRSTRIGVDAVVGMAIYTGRLDITDGRRV